MAIRTTRGPGRAVGLPGLLLAAANATAAVTELKPQEVAAFVARHPVAVIQFTSPDRGCGALQAWQVRQLGIAMDSPPREQDCQRMLDGLGAGAGAPDAPRRNIP